MFYLSGPFVDSDQTLCFAQACKQTKKTPLLAQRGWVQRAPPGSNRKCMLPPAHLNHSLPVERGGWMGKGSGSARGGKQGDGGGGLGIFFYIL
jgi:hypothetical protein